VSDHRTFIFRHEANTYLGLARARWAYLLTGIGENYTEFSEPRAWPCLSRCCTPSIIWIRPLLPAQEAWLTADSHTTTLSDCCVVCGLQMENTQLPLSSHPFPTKLAAGHLLYGHSASRGVQVRSIPQVTFKLQRFQTRYAQVFNLVLLLLTFHNKASENKCPATINIKVYAAIQQKLSYYPKQGIKFARSWGKRLPNQDRSVQERIRLAKKKSLGQACLLTSAAICS